MTETKIDADRARRRIRRRFVCAAPVAASSRGSSRTSAITSPIRSCRSIAIPSRAPTRATCTKRAKARAAQPAPAAAVAAATRASREAQPNSCFAVVGRAARRPRGRATRGSRRRAAALVRRRRRDDSRPVGARAQAICAEVLRLGQPLRRQGQQRFDRRRHDGEPVHRGTHAALGRARLLARPLDDEHRVHEQRRERLPGRDVQLRHQPRHVRRSHDRVARLLARQRHGRPPRRRDVQRYRATAAISDRRLADPHQEPARSACRSRRSPTRASSTIRIGRCAIAIRRLRKATATSASSIRARARATRARFGLRYYLPYRAAIHAEYRQYGDTWDIQADTFELGYTHPIESGWTIEGKVRSYSQTKADFYSDLFARSRFQNFMARDKELSTFTSQTLRLGGELRHRARRVEVRRAWHRERRSSIT